MWYKLLKLADRRQYLINKRNISPQIANWAYNLALQIDKKATYTEWLAVLASQNKLIPQEDDVKLVELLTEYNEAKKKKDFPTELKNINQFKSFPELYRAISPYLKVKSIREQEQEAILEGQKKVYDKDNIQVYEISNEEATSQLCKGTGWCVKDPKFAKDYLREGNLFLFIQNGIRTALLHPPRREFKDVSDAEISTKTAINLFPAIKEVFRLLNITQQDMEEGEVSEEYYSLQNAAHVIYYVSRKVKAYQRHPDQKTLNLIAEEIEYAPSLTQYIPENMFRDANTNRLLIISVVNGIKEDPESYNALPPYVRTPGAQQAFIDSVKNKIQNGETYITENFYQLDIDKHFPPETRDVFKSDQEFIDLWLERTAEEIGNHKHNWEHRNIGKKVFSDPDLYKLITKYPEHPSSQTIQKDVQDVWIKKLDSDPLLIKKTPPYIINRPELNEVIKSSFAYTEAKKIIDRETIRTYNKVMLRGGKLNDPQAIQQARKDYKSINPDIKESVLDRNPFPEPEMLLPDITPEKYRQDPQFEDMIYKKIFEVAKQDRDISGLFALPEHYREREGFREGLKEILLYILRSPFSHAELDDKYIIDLSHEFDLVDEYIKSYARNFSAQPTREHEKGDTLPSFIANNPENLENIQNKIIEHLRQMAYRYDTYKLRTLARHFRISEDDPRIRQAVKESYDAHLKAYPDSPFWGISTRYEVEPQDWPEIRPYIQYNIGRSIAASDSLQQMVNYLGTQDTETQQSPYVIEGIKKYLVKYLQKKYNFLSEQRNITAVGYWQRVILQTKDEIQIINNLIAKYPQLYADAEIQTLLNNVQKANEAIKNRIEQSPVTASHNMGWYKKSNSDIKYISHNSYGQLKLLIDGKVYTYYDVSPFVARKINNMIARKVPTGVIIQHLKQFSRPELHNQDTKGPTLFE